MGSAQHPAGSRRQLIVHHLSDLQYEDVAEHQQNKMLVRYQRHLGGLLPARHPDVVVITGNLTTTGKANDLRAVATALHICFASWEKELHKRVFIVPGPRDVNWEDGSPNGLEEFYRIFSDFALPYHKPMPSGQDTPASGQQNFIGYPINTCYSPNELQASLEGKVEQYSKSYRRFIKRHSKLNTRWMGLWKRTWRLRRQQRDRVKKTQLASLRAQFLGLTESGQLVDLRDGRITESDLERLKGWATPNTGSANQSAGDISPLKILITYHPFAIHTEHDTATDARQVPQNPFKQAAKMAGKAGFHLALHGHVNNPQLLTDALLFDGPDYPHPIRQMGAASLGETGIFNEITAVALDGNGETDWRLTPHLIDLKSSTPFDVDILAQFHHAETADKEIKKLERDATRRREFERAMRAALRRFSEQVYKEQGYPGQPYQAQPYQGPSTNRQDAANIAQLPQVAMNLIQDVVRRAIFDGYDSRVRLLLKSTEKRGAIPQLVPTYLVPEVMEGPDALVYPASVAAWALILGRTLIYPAIKRQGTNVEDHEWLRRTGKIEPLLSVLDTLVKNASGQNYGREASDRYRTLHTNLEAISGAATGTSDGMIAGEQIYQPAASGSPPESYPYFVCVPYPMRPSSGGPPALPEIMVLDVSVRPIEQIDGEQITGNSGATDPLTEERVAMLETLAEVIGTMLTTASALGRPRGVWDNRYLP